MTLGGRAVKLPVKMTINGQTVSHEVEPRLLLVHYIRENVGLTGTHVGCDTSQCGACTILMNGQAVKACNLFAVQCDGADIMTIEGLAKDGELHPVQKALLAEQAAQCGFCISGIAVAAAAFLSGNHNPSEKQVREALDRNLCRCGSHNRVVRAVLRAAREMQA
jgi:carbon-monoxide dehydrogenase small subunit